jgi:hypothetical protein
MAGMCQKRAFGIMRRARWPGIPVYPLGGAFADAGRGETLVRRIKSPASRSAPHTAPAEYTDWVLAAPHLVEASTNRPRAQPDSNLPVNQLFKKCLVTARD